MKVKGPKLPFFRDLWAASVSQKAREFARAQGGPFEDLKETLLVGMARRNPELVYEYIAKHSKVGWDKSLIAGAGVGLTTALFASVSASLPLMIVSGLGAGIIAALAVRNSPYIKYELTAIAQKVSESFRRVMK